MNLQVLVSAMYQDDISLAKKINIKSDAIIINQCNIYNYEEEVFDGNIIKMISNTNRGLSRSRNEALLNASGDICILCDDDVHYDDNYVEIILSAFKKLPDADIIIFDIEMCNYSGSRTPKHINKIRKSPRNKHYGSVRMAFKLKSFTKNNIWFNINFGAGSIYGAGEESLVIREANNNKLKIYEYPAIIAKVDYSDSTWFNGYNEKFFYDIGAWLSVAYPKSKHLMKLYYPITFNRHTDLSSNKIIKLINEGIASYNELSEFSSKHNNKIIK